MLCNSITAFLNLKNNVAFDTTFYIQIGIISLTLPIKQQHFDFSRPKYKHSTF